MISRKCEQHIWNTEDEEWGWSYCNEPAAVWAKRVLMDCDDDPGIVAYEAYCEAHWSASAHLERVSSEEIDVLEVHES